MAITDLVLPTLLTKLQPVLDGMKAFGHPMRICQGARTVAEQYQLWRQGREIPGPGVDAAHPLGRTVTECDGTIKRSNHQVQADGFGHAVDCCFVGADPWNDKGPKQLWDIFGLMVEATSTLIETGGKLRWGGRFPKIDRPHVEWRG